MPEEEGLADDEGELSHGSPDFEESSEGMTVEVGYISSCYKRVSNPKERLAASLVVGTVRRLSAPQLTLPWPKRHAADLTHRVRTAHGRSRRARPP